METIVSVISLTAITSVLNSISTLSVNIYSLMNNIKLNKTLYNTEIANILSKTDIETTIQLLEVIISEIPEYYLKSTSVLLALKNLRNIIADIEEDLTSIHNKLCYNKSLYIMSNWRSYDFKDDIISLQNKIDILEKRRENLFKTLEVFKFIPYEDYRKPDIASLSASKILELEYKPKQLKSIEITEIQDIDSTGNIIDGDACVL